MILHCFSAPPERVAEAAEHGWLCSFAGNVTYPKAEELREAARRVPDELLLVETDSPFLAPQPVRGKPNQPANVVATAERVAEVRGIALRATSRAWSRRTPRASSGGERGPPRPELPRRPQPARRDRPRRRAWATRDVVLEVGGGEGALTERLAPPVADVVVVELDRGLERALGGVAAAHPQRRLVWGDAMRVDLAELDPAPTAVVSNLPYSIATPLILRTIAELPSVRSWTVLVQREIADRLRAAPGTRTYGSPSVLVQLACEVKLLRAVDRAVFTPRPRVDSALLRLRAHRPGRLGRAGGRWCGRLRAPAQDARRLARSWRAARRREWFARRWLGPVCPRTRGRRRWRPADFVRLARAAGAVTPGDAARLRQAQPLPATGRRGATTACTSCARCSARWRWPTGS